MKKYAVLVFLCFSIVFAAQSQSKSYSPFQFGIKGGLNFSELRTDDKNWLSADVRTGYQIGIWASIGGVGLHVQPELYLTGKSTQAKLVDRDEEGKVSFTSLDLPVLLGTRVGTGGFGLRLLAGPVVSFVTQENIGSTLEQLTQFKDYKDQTWGVVGGLGLDISRLRADVRYEHGLTNMSNVGGSSQKMKLWTVGVGYRLF